eukprot:s2182_g4.t1
MSYTQVSAGSNHTVLLQSDGHAVAFGANRCGQCKIPSPMPGHCYVPNHTPLDKSMVLQLDCVSKGDAVKFKCSDLAGEEKLRVKAHRRDLAFNLQKYVACKLSVNLQSLQLIGPDGQLLTSLCRANPRAKIQEGLLYMKEWDTFVEGKNAVASMTANRAWHTASIWVRSEAEVAIIGSTIDTIIIATCSGWAGVFLFTGDLWLAVIVTCVVIVVITGLAFYISCIMAWSIGPIEVISLVVFVGYSVTYALHIAHNYNQMRDSDKDLLEAEAKVRMRKMARAKAQAARKRAAAAAAGAEEDLEDLQAAVQLDLPEQIPQPDHCFPKTPSCAMWSTRCVPPRATSSSWVGRPRGTRGAGPTLVTGSQPSRGGAVWRAAGVAAALRARSLAQNAQSGTAVTAEATTTTPVIHKWPKREIRGLLQELKTKEPVLAKYLEYAGDPWVTDFAELRPLMEVHFDEISHESVSQLDAWKVKGELKEINYQIQQLKRGRFFALVACDVHHCGFVTGAGLAVGREDAKQLAAKQALERLFFPAEPLEELRRCALSVRQHEVHAGARIPAIQAAETLAVLGEKLEDVHLSAFQPCGKAWQAAITCMCLEHRVTGPSADYDRNVAMALAGEMFMSRLRWYMRVPAGDPHEPELWASTWEQRRESLGKPWSGRTSVLKHEILRLQRLGKQTSDEDEILRLLPSESRWKTTQRILEDAQALRCRRLADAKETMTTTSAAAASEATGSAVRRDFEVTPRAEDPRRPELRGALPIEQIRPDLGQLLQDTQVLVVSGGTGSGKTTQLPQFLLDDWRSSDVPRVVVTQPRRIAAISVAERVAWERGGCLGETVGYSVHGEMVRPQSSEGSIEYVTVGTLLRRAVSDITLEQCNIVIVDEVHERDLLTDFLLILLRELLPSRPDMRLLLMSATLDVTSFSEYFNCPALQVQSESLFPVEEIHLEDPFFQDFVFTNALLSSEKQSRSNPEDNDGDMEKCLDIMDSSICSVVEEMSQRNSSDVGSILCFLPGWWEIRQMEERLAQGDQASKIWAIPLHSTLPKERQQQVFRKPPKGKVKVILGTNIAESSVTIGDVEVVIDSGLQRELTYDPKRRLSSLDTVWVSQSGAVQRRGRAGRVRQGRLLRCLDEFRGRVG